MSLSNSTEHPHSQKLLAFKHSFDVHGGSLIAQLVKNLPAMWETLVRFLSLADMLEKG